MSETPIAWEQRGTRHQRLGVMGDLFACPTFPLAPKAGWYQSFATWMRELCEERCIGERTRDVIIAWEREYGALFEEAGNPRRNELKGLITRACRLIVTEKWDELAAFAGE